MKLLVMMTFSFTLYAQTLSDCYNSGSNYGSQDGTPTSIASTCAPLIIGQANNVNEDYSSDGLIQVVGKGNLLMVQINALDVDDNPVYLRDEFTSGKKSQLNNIIAVDFNEADARVYVLNESIDSKRQVYSYVYDVGGNNIPLRELVTDDITAATNLRVHGEETLLVSSSEQWVRVFNRLADPDGKKTENSNAILRELSGANTLLSSPIDVEIYNNEIFVLDNDRVLVFNLSDNGDVSPKRVISGANTQLSGALKLEINSSNEIVITNSDSSIKRFLSSASGNASPH